MSPTFSRKRRVKENTIKCKICKQEFRVKNNEFKSNDELAQIIERQSHLSDEEISLKQKLEISIKKFFAFFDEFIQNRTKLDMDVFEHFQEIRFQIDEQREELKKSIDDIAMAMIDETKEYEEIYLKDLKERFSSIDDCKSLEIKLIEIEELFRNPNILTEAVKKMQQKQEESLKDIQFKLNEMKQVKDDLSETNEFIPNVSPFNQEEDTSLFGSVELNGYWLNLNSLKSEIINDEQQCLELIKLCEFSPNDKFRLLYRATRDGFCSNDFHFKCDGHSNTLTILRAKESEFVFGGFASVEWDSFSKDKPDPNAFIFSLTKPLKMKVDPNHTDMAIYCDSEFGPVFGDGICIANNANTTMYSRSDLGWTYKHPVYDYFTYEAQSFLAGSIEFQLDEIEVYEKKMNL